MLCGIISRKYGAGIQIGRRRTSRRASISFEGRRSRERGESVPVLPLRNFHARRQLDYRDAADVGSAHDRPADAVPAQQARQGSGKGMFVQQAQQARQRSGSMMPLQQAQQKRSDGAISAQRAARRSGGGHPSHSRSHSVSAKFGG